MTTTAHRRTWLAWRDTVHVKLALAGTVPIVISLLVSALLLTSCSIFAQYRSFAELAADATALPVPKGVRFVSEVRSIEDGPGFTTTKSEQVVRQFATSLSCQALERSWAAALQGANRKFRFDNVAHKFGAIGSLGIVITDRPENLGITIGTDNGDCNRPFIYSFNSPH